MAKKEKLDQNTEIEYTPEELQEIDRIVSSLPGAPAVPSDDSSDGGNDYMDLSAFDSADEGNTPDIESIEPTIEPELDVEPEPISEIENPDLDSDSDSEDDFEMPEEIKLDDELSDGGDDDLSDSISEMDFEAPENISDIESDDELSDLGEMSEEDLSGDFDSVDDIPEEDISDNEIQDITSFIEEVPGEPIDDSLEEAEEPGLDDLSEDLSSFSDEDSGNDEFADLGSELDGFDDADDFSEVSEDESGDSFSDLGADSDLDLGDLGGFDESASDEESDDLGDIDTGGFDDSLGDIPGLNDDESSDEVDEIAEGPVSTMGQLNALTKDEPDSLDDQEIDEEAVVDNTVSQIPDDDSSDDSMPEMDDLEDIDIPEETDVSAAEGVSLETEDSEEIPDLSDLSLGDMDAVSEAGDSDIPDLDIGGLDGDDELPELDDIGGSSEMDDIDAFDDSHLEDMDEPDLSLDAMDSSDDLEVEDSSSEVDDMFADLPDIPDMDQVDEVVENEPIPDIPDLDEDDSTPAAASSSGESLDLSADELRKVKKALLLFPPGLTDAIKDTILNDRMSAAETRRLVDMILDGRPENNIHRYLEKKLDTEINKEGGKESTGRRALYARPEYTAEGRERQKALLKRTAIISSVAMITAVIFFLSFQYIYKPMKAKSLINGGVELIRRDNDPKIPDYKLAEEKFDNALGYVNDFSLTFFDDYEAYNKYGRAYFFRKEYDRALDKFNKAYDIGYENNFEDVLVLNNLGYFFSRMPDSYFNRVKSELENYYYKDKFPSLEKIDTKYDVAVDFYRKALNVDPKNIASMFGIGNAYYAQGQFLKAKNYYMNILKTDPDSIVGYSGLLNLYIERNDFPDALMVFVDLRDKGLLEEVPSALLGKLTNYFLSKSKSDAVNIRIDYGIQSPRLKDSDDQPFPAVLTVLRALKNRDDNYPPLYLYYAKLAEKMKNYKLVEKHLERAIEKADDRKQNYFDARHMLGEFHYKTKNPVKAYKNLKMALKASENPADFTEEDFYKNTESVGKTYAVMGNIFYYFFDKVRFDLGDQESISEDEMRKNENKMANFIIAQEKYETALANGYSSSELNYNLGRIYYLNRNYEKAMNQWLNLYEDFTVSPELMFALGNVFYKVNSYDSAKAQYLKLTDIFEYKASGIKNIKRQNPQHIKIFRTLSSAYNNLGVIYQVEGDEEKSNICYWKSIEYAKMLEQESEFSRVNIARSFKERTEPIVPILDDNIPYSIDYFREDMRKYWDDYVKE